MGYYSDDTQAAPYVNVKTILYRNDPILTCAPQHKPVDETGLLKGIAGAAQIWRALDACGVPDVLGVWNHEAGPATRFTAIQIRQRYPGHARQALHVACACQGGAYAGKWTVVVDDDIDAGDLDQVLWAMCTRFDPKVDIDLIQKAWASKRDPLFLPGNFNNRILIDACIPYDMKLKGTFPPVVDVSADLRTQAAGEVSEAVSLRIREWRVAMANGEWRIVGSYSPSTLFATSLFALLREQLLAHGVEARLLIVAERIVEVVQRRADGVDRLQHGLQMLAGRGEPRRRRARALARTSRLDDVGAVRGCRLQGVELGALRIVRLHRLIDLLGRPRHDRRIAVGFRRGRIGGRCA